MKRTALFFLFLGALALAACDAESEPTDVIGDTPADTGTDVPPEDVPPDVCTPSCQDKECGPDGCGGECGTCTGVGESCQDGECVACENPTTWGPLGMVATGEFPGVDESKTACPDFSGDSVGDNAVAGLLALELDGKTLNQILQEEITKGFYGAVAEFLDVTDWTDQDAFTFNAFAAGTETPGSTALYANPLWFSPATCMPWVHATDAKIEGGVLTVPAHDYHAEAAWRGIDLAGTVKMAQVKGTVASSAGGVVLTGGVLAGVLTKADIDAAVAAVVARCAESDPPGLCTTLADYGVEDLQAALAGIYDLDLDSDSTKDAASICVKFTLQPATILGYGVE